MVIVSAVEWHYDIQPNKKRKKNLVTCVLPRPLDSRSMRCPNLIHHLPQYYYKKKKGQALKKEKKKEERNACWRMASRSLRDLERRLFISSLTPLNTVDNSMAHAARTSYLNKCCHKIID